MNEEIRNKIELLDKHHDWPCPYTFKFIVPTERLEELCGLLVDFELNYRPSRSGKYTSVTLEPVLESAMEVLAIYDRTAGIEGILSL